MMLPVGKCILQTYEYQPEEAMKCTVRSRHHPRIVTCTSNYSLAPLPKCMSYYKP